MNFFSWFATGLVFSFGAVVVSVAERPNILIILTDDMGFSDLGCFGGEIETPNLDALARGGLRFTEFYNSARCWPTRATLMSGRYSDRLGPAQITIAEALRAAGYQTGMVGKWHLGLDPEKDGPIQRGFDDFYGTMTGAGSFWDPYADAQHRACRAGRSRLLLHRQDRSRGCSSDP